MTTKTLAEGTPWYQNFWPWFIVILLGVSVIASLATVVIAYQHRDVDVRIGGSADAHRSDATPTRKPAP